MQIGDLISLGFDRVTDLLRHLRVRRAVEQDATGIAEQARRPVGDNQRADETGKRIHPEPTEAARQHQSDNHQNGYRRIGQNVNDCRTHIIVAVVRDISMYVLVGMRVIVVVIMLMLMIMMVTP